MEQAAQKLNSARSVGLVFAILVAVLGIFWRTTASMVEIWETSGTYSHGFLIVPIFLGLVWSRRLTLSRLPLRPSWFGLLGLAGLGLVWLIGDLAATAAPAQFAVVAMVPMAVATVLGTRWVGALAFPFAFLFFAVPFGDWLIPYMMDSTADFTVAALKLSGVPVFREGNHFSIPSGDWSVIEACSGIRYLFACLATTTLFAWTVYRTTKRRLVFVGVALAIAVIANWLRAYTIVMAAHLIDYGLANGIDHIIYGGLFFALIMAIVFWLGMRWREDDPDEALVGAAGPQRTEVAPAAPPRTRSALAGVLAAATLSVWPLASPGIAPPSLHASEAVADIAPNAGWVRVDESPVSWRPHLTNPSRERSQVFVKGGRRVSVYLGVFDRLTPDSKLASSVNQLVGSQDLHWIQAQRGVSQAHRGAEVIPVNTATLVGPEGRIAVWHWYWVDGTWTSSPARAVLAQLLARLGGRSERSAWVSVYTIESEHSTEAQPALQAFASDMLDSIDRALRASGAASQ